MTLEEMIAIIEPQDDIHPEYSEFELVENKLSARSDLHAFILLDQLVPGNDDIVSDADHDTIWLGVESEELAAVVTEEQLTDLVRCGLSYDAEHDSFSMNI